MNEPNDSREGIPTSTWEEREQWLLRKFEGLNPEVAQRAIEFHKAAYYRRNTSKIMNQRRDAAKEALTSDSSDRRESIIKQLVRG